jgi:hypothetical protein
MRILLLITALCGILNTDLSAQIYLKRGDQVVDLDTMTQAHYISLNIWPIPFSPRVRVLVDCGQGFDGNDNRSGFELVDRKGEGIRFGSRMSAFNFLYQQGWLYKNTFLFVNSSSSDERHIFERKKGDKPANDDGY